MDEQVPSIAQMGWGKIVEAVEYSHRSSSRMMTSRPSTPSAVRCCWADVANAEPGIVANVVSMLDWAPMCALRTCQTLTAESFELWSSQPIANVELSWVRVPTVQRRSCLRFLSEHCSTVRNLCITDVAQFGEQALLRLVCGMRLLESLDVEAPLMGGGFPDPQRLLDRLSKYCPRLRHLAISFRHERPSERLTLSIMALARLGRRLLTLDLGAVAVRVTGGTQTLATCCPQLERLCVQLCLQHGGGPVDDVSPSDLSKGCRDLQEFDVAPVDWDDSVLRRFAADALNLRSLALRHVAPSATAELLEPLLVQEEPDLEKGLTGLHLALHARSDPDRANAWLATVARIRSLRALCLDFAAPLRLADIAEVLSGHVGQTSGDVGCCELTALTVHGCHGVDDVAISLVTKLFPKIEMLRVFPDSWREVGEVTDEALATLVRQLPRLRSLAIGSHLPLQVGGMDGLRPKILRSLSLFAPLGDEACSVLAGWPSLRSVWLGPHKLMQRGVSAESSISDDGLGLLAHGCRNLVDLTVASRRITDCGAKAVLLTCRELRRLRVGGRGVTDATLQLLPELHQPRLERLALWCSGTTADGIRQAEEQTPWTHFDIEVADAD